MTASTSPTREQVDRRGRLFRAGGPRKADLIVLDDGPRPVLVKDFSRKSPWRRALGRLQTAREHRAYLRAGPLRGLPRLVGRVDAHALAVEKVEGVPLAHAESRYRDAELHLARLRELIDRLHARGIVHLDLRGKGNLMLRADGEVVAVDLAAALWLRPGGLWHRLLFRWFAIADETAFLKWKTRLAQDLVTREERSRLGRFRALRSIWIFNRRHARPAPPKPGGSRAKRADRR